MEHGMPSQLNSRQLCCHATFLPGKVLRYECMEFGPVSCVVTRRLLRYDGSNADENVWNLVPVVVLSRDVSPGRSVALRLK